MAFDVDPRSRFSPSEMRRQNALPDSDAQSRALQILTAEQWSLLSSRNLGYTEAMSRGALFIAALSGAVVALALVAQATNAGNAFVAFALVLLPVVYFLGLVTVVRIAQLNWEDSTWVQGLNRIRHACLEIAPELEPYFITSSHDDAEGVVWSAIARRPVRSPLQSFVSLPGMVAVVDSVVAGATAGIAMRGLGFGTGSSLAVGAAAFGVSIAGFVVFAVHSIRSNRRSLAANFPSARKDG